MFEFVATVDDIKTVPADFRGLYKEDGDKFVLRKGDSDPGIAGAVKALQGQHAALQSERALNKTLKGKAVDLSALSVYGSTVEEIATGVQTALSDAGKGKKGPEEFQTALTAAVEKERQTHVTEKETLTTRVAQLVGNVSHLMVGTQAATALAAAGVETPELLMPFLKEKVQVVEEEGEFQVQVLDADGKTPRFSGTGTGLFTVADLVAEMREDKRYGNLFASQEKSGGGAGGGRGIVRPGGKKVEDMSAHDKKVAGLAARGK